MHVAPSKGSNCRNGIAHRQLTMPSLLRKSTTKIDHMEKQLTGGVQEPVTPTAYLLKAASQ